MYDMTKKIYDALLKSEAQFKVFIEDNEDQSVVWLQFGTKNGSSYRIRFISRDNDNDVAVRVFGLISVDESKRDEILHVINTLNRKYRYLKFLLDDDGDLNVEYDFPVRFAGADQCAEEMVVRFATIIDEAYPLLMRTLWT